MREIDRRDYKRVAADILCALTLPNGIKYPAMARNLSLGGAFVECERRLAKGDRVKLGLNLQVAGRIQKVELEGEIVHGPARVSMTAHGFGIGFFELEGSERELVQEFVDARHAI